MKFRHELKHNINYSDLLILKGRLSAILAHDENSGEDGTYFVKSLYFDNYTDKALREKLDGSSEKWVIKTVWGVGYKFELLN